MNRVFLIGNLTRDPELTETTSGVSLCRFAIAVNRNYSSGDGERKTDFFNCVAWRGLGENVARYAKKGNKVAVMGSVELRNYEDSTGAKRTAVDIVCNDVEFLTPKGTQSGDDYDSPAPAEKKRAALQAFDDDSDIPF
ncbi:MAG: single-stranded DNA-binding protein [Clostridia bacterium]|nr:single-stranded DNA-binding protein [Clostridia bacterium]